MTASLVETVARAICCPKGCPHNGCALPATYRHEARAAIAAVLADMEQVSEGVAASGIHAEIMEAPRDARAFVTDYLECATAEEAAWSGKPNADDYDFRAHLMKCAWRAMLAEYRKEKL